LSAELPVLAAAATKPGSGDDFASVKRRFAGRNDGLRDEAQKGALRSALRVGLTGLDVSECRQSVLCD